METASTPSKPLAGGLLIGRATAPLMALHRRVAGAPIFGICWGIAGFCPGSALPVLGTRRIQVAAFVVAVVAGTLATRLRPKPNGTGPSGTQPEPRDQATR